MAYPSPSNSSHFLYRSFRGTVKFSMNSFSSSCGVGFLFVGFVREIVTWIMRRFVLQKPGSVISRAWLEKELREGEHDSEKGIKQGKKERKRKRNIPFHITPVPANPSPQISPTYPVSSFNSLSAHSSAVSPSSMRPAGTSMQTLSIGGRNCFWRRIRGGELAGSRMATIPTPSMGLLAGRVRRWADS